MRGYVGRIMPRDGEDHLCKVVLLRGGARYVSKGNYNVCRIAYLRRLFPDAKFVVPVREPVARVHSLVKQHRLFTDYRARCTRARVSSGGRPLGIRSSATTDQPSEVARGAGDRGVAAGRQLPQVRRDVGRGLRPCLTLHYRLPELAERIHFRPLRSTLPCAASRARGHSRIH